MIMLTVILLYRKVG